MHILIVGHSSGIGDFLYNYFTNLKTTFSVKGISRKSGHDISTEKGVKSAVSLAKEYDVIILNAHASYSQVDTLYSLFSAHRATHKRIIVMGSQSSDGVKNFPHKYAIEKAALEKCCEQLQNCPSNLSITLLKPGWVSTERVKKLTTESALELNDLADIIDYLIRLPTRVEVKKVSINQKKEVLESDFIKNPWNQD